MRVLVTGATGFIASHLLPALTEAGHEVVALGHDPARIPSVEGVAPFVADLRRAEDVRFPDADAVVHLAQANVPLPEGAADLFAVNTASTAVLLEHARRVARRFVYASSASVYGGGERAFDENDPPLARDFYAATKIGAEALVGAYSDLLEGTTTLRLVAPYGPGQRGRLIPTLIERVREGRAVVLNEGGRPRLNPIYVVDVVRVVLRALELPGHRVVNVGGDEIVGVRDLAEAIGEVLGSAPVYEAAEGGTATDLVARNERMKRELGVDDLVPLAEGLRRMAGVRAAA
jgi:nucleoside-diphosphate-sugar epimerase